MVVHETKLQIVLRNDTEKSNEFTPENTSQTRRIHRSKSDKVTSEKPKDEENKVVLRRSDTEKLQPTAAAEENDEFSSMSDEELNRRIEEFIQKFNRQIRASRDQ